MGTETDFRSSYRISDILKSYGKKGLCLILLSLRFNEHQNCMHTIHKYNFEYIGLKLIAAIITLIKDS